MKRYNWEQSDWPNFTYNLAGTDDLLLKIQRNEGKYAGLIDILPKNEHVETIIDMMVLEAIKTSAIEGEFYSRQDVLSSIKKNIGVHQKVNKISNKNAEHISALLVAMRQTYQKPLTKKILFQWHSTLFETEKGIEIGRWRTHSEPMQVISGAMGKTKVHFEAPPSIHVPKEMEQFIKWFNDTAPKGKTPIYQGPIRAAIAHLYFLSIHPFEDGNGRIARALAEKVLSQANQQPVLLSLSYSLEKEKKKYYEQLQIAQKQNNISKWIKFFLHTILDAQQNTERHINFTLRKIKFIDYCKKMTTERQQKAIFKVLEKGFEGYEGGLNARKYASMTKTSKATATRDLQDLTSLGLIIPFGAGRSVSYELNLDFLS